MGLSVSTVPLRAKFLYSNGGKMFVRILEKIYHHTNNPNLSTPFRRKREEDLIRQLGTATPYGCNDHINSIGNLTSRGCQSVNALNLLIFNQTRWIPRSHGSRSYNKPEIHDISFDGLLLFVNVQLGLHHIRIIGCTLFHWKCYMNCTNLHWPYILLTLHRNIDFRYHFGYFLQQTFQSCQGRLTYRNQEPPISESQICQ